MYDASFRAWPGALLLGSLAFPGCQAPGAPPDPAPLPEIAAPLWVRSDGLPLLEVALPRGLTAWFLLDTGSGSFTLIDRQLSRELGLRHEVVQDHEASFLHVHSRLPYLAAAATQREDVRVFVEDLGSFEHLRDSPVGGVLGTDVLRGSCVSLDLRNGRYSTNHPRVLQPEQVALPLGWGPQGTLWLTVTVRGHPARAWLNTGAARTVVSAAFLRGIGWQAVPPVDGSEWTVTLEGLALGPATVPALTCRAGVETELPPRSDLSLGMDVLGRFGLILDLAERPYLVLDPARGNAAFVVEALSMAPEGR